MLIIISTYKTSNTFLFSSTPVTPETIKSIWYSLSLSNSCQLHFLFPHYFSLPQKWLLYLLVPFIYCSWSKWSLSSRGLYFPFQDKYYIWHSVAFWAIPHSIYILLDGIEIVLLVPYVFYTEICAMLLRWLFLHFINIFKLFFSLI